MHRFHFSHDHVFYGFCSRFIADSDEHETRSSLLEGSNYSVSYTLNGNDVIEKLLFYENGVTTIVRTVHPDDTMDVQIIDPSGEITVAKSNADYSLFYEVYTDQENYRSGRLAQIPSFAGNEISGSQYKHRYIGTSGTSTMYASDLRNCKKASEVASILSTASGNVTAAVISATATFIFDQMLQSMSSSCYKVTMSSVTYEVWLTASNTYYIHCYHQTIKEYKSNGSLIRSKTDYYQAIGG